MNYIKKIFTKNKKGNSFTIEEKKVIYSHMTSGEIDEIKEFFRKITEKNINTLRFTNVPFL